ncbi:MAG: hypothetical protein WCY06_08920 [Flavobacteriaceae bacterium]
MKKLITYFFILFCVNAFAQKTYTFDYYTVYEYKKKESDKKSVSEYTFSNSNDNYYYLRFAVEDSIIQNTIQLIDYKNQQIYLYDIEPVKNKSVSNLSNLFKFEHKSTYDLTECRTVNRYIYKIDFYDDKEYSFSMEQYKKRNSKLVETSYYQTVADNEIKNQIYNSFLAVSLHCNKFKIDMTDVIVYSYFKKRNSKKRYNIRELVAMEKIDLTINTTS